MKLRVMSLLVLTGLVLSAFRWMPESGLAGSAIRMKLPEQLGEWEFERLQPSEIEIRGLAKDTEFSKAMCFGPSVGGYGFGGRSDVQRVDLSVVLSGADLNASIHRPERCMPAQGHTIEKSEERTLRTPDGHMLPVTELLSRQRLQLKSGDEVSLRCVTLYFFVGQHVITRSHTERTMLDMKDRIFHGRNQRWAYVSASCWYVGDGEENRFHLPTFEASRGRLSELVEKLSDGAIDWEEIR